MADWYRLPVRASPAMVLIIAMGSYPRKLTAGGMIELSYLTFGTVSHTSSLAVRSHPRWRVEILNLSFLDHEDDIGVSGNGKIDG